MSYNGSGTFLINSAGQPVVANTVISATVFNALTSDLATGLSTAITKDGQTTITANIPFGSNKITGLGAGTAATDAANLSQVQSTAAKLVTVTGTDTITGSMSPQLTAYAAGQLFYFVANAANTGPVTINIDSLGAKAITRDGSTALAAGDINSGEVVVVIYDGTRFQMINAANSFGNTTINGTLTVTGNTGLQANVSITSTLSVGGTFAVTGAATLGSTLAVTGKSDLPTVSTASINAAVALITTGTVTNLTASGASIASANIGNLQFTAASIASINAGVAVITNLTATGASIASANVGTAVITAATVTGASIASANVGTAVITTGTVTNLTSTSASVASINAAVALITTGTVTNLTSTGASVASANVGVGVITALTATGASVASANVGTAVVTGLTVTNASIASLNAGTATVTTGNLTFSSTAQRITGDMSNATFSSRLAFQSSTTNGNTILGILANGTPADLAGTGVVCNAVSDTTNTQTMSMFVFKNLEASLRSNAAGTGTYLPMTFYTSGTEKLRIAADATGTYTFGGTAPRITGDFSNGTFSNRLSFQSSTTNGVTGVQALPNGTNQTATFDVYNAADPTNASFGQLQINSGDVRVVSNIRGTGTYLPMTFYTGGSERMRLDTSGNLLVGTATGLAGSRFTVVGGGTQLSGGTTAQEGVRIQRATGYATFTGINNDNNAYNGLQFFTSASAAVTIDTSGNVGIGGTASAFDRVTVTGTLPSSSGFSIGFGSRGTIPSTSTSLGIGFSSVPSTQAASFTLSGLTGFYAGQGTFGAGSTVTNQYGYYAENNLTGATNNYGFYSAIASGTNRWNFYANGTANNYFAGNTGVGSTDVSITRLRVTGAGATSATYATYMDTSGGAQLFSVRNDGAFFTGTHTNSPYNLTTASAANCFINADGALYRSTSSLRYKSDVADAAHGLADVLKLRSVTYKAKNDGDTVFGGLIAEEVHDAGLTEFVAYDKEGRPDALHYGNMVALLVKAVQELKAELEALKAA